MRAAAPAGSGAGFIAGGDAALERQAGAGGKHATAERDRVAVHGGLIEQRHREGRDDLFRKRAPCGFAKRHLVDALIGVA